MGPCHCYYYCRNGFFTNAYDLFCISLVTKLLGRIYYHVDGAPKPGSLPPNVSAAVNGVSLRGTLAGQLFFGWLGDKLGRKRVYGLTLMLMCLCSIAPGLSFGREPKNCYGHPLLLSLLARVWHWSRPHCLDCPTIFMFALAFPRNHWTHPDHRIGFVVMSSLTFFFANFGPKATTFVVPAEIFPGRLKSTCLGISAASGKLGATVGAFGFLYLAQNQDKAKADAGYPAGIGVKNSLIFPLQL
ncbi:hypothetical protein RHMOL_Rhmol06G0208400 [Rhododendron molle]|uniref:Uncharacterized protein n=1 Tax=Rhododendron molle TaxID=49168 RepID=A0ACC0NED1_RHOML|nr:hypothetical protein RHMOL_Rhmol06G0208400 [Rhododendron molle]